jgi:Type II secretion system (T2SS), protein M
MMARLSQRERRLVAIAFLVALVALAWLGFLSPLFDGFSRRAREREFLQLRFAHNERAIANIAALRRSSEQQRQSGIDYRTPGATVAEATEALKERLAAVLTAEGGELRAIQDVSDRPGWARVWAEARLSLPQFVSALTKVQNQPPWLAVTGVTVSADRALQSGKLDQMDVRIEVSSPIAPTKSR